jgi:hypothetical protein
MIYGNGHQAVDDVSFDIKAGRRFLWKEYFNYSVSGFMQSC